MIATWPLPDTFTIRLTLRSDWHVGSGTGRPGNVDRLIIRDADGLPFVPAKTLRGIWRDACERLTFALDDGRRGGPWALFLDFLFGSQPALGRTDPEQEGDASGRHDDPSQPPLESALTVRSARMPAPLRRRIAANRCFLDALTLVKPGVAIDRRSGTARNDCLRFEEMARAGAVLEAACALPAGLSPELCAAASAILIAGVKLVERLGGKRRRGPGACDLEVIGADLAQAIAWIEARTSPPAWITANPNVTSGTGTAATPADGWVVVPLVLDLSGPLAVSYRTVGNVVETLDFLPGSYLLPHVTRALGGPGLDIRGAIQRGEVCVLAGTLEVADQRGRPVPMALFANKDDETRILNRLVVGESEEGQFKQVRAGYVVPDRPPGTVPVAVRTHNTVADGPQRPTSDVGGVYTYEAIAPVRLRSELRLRKSLAERLPANWMARLAGPVALGRSKKDDYGEVKITVEKAAEFASAPPAGDGTLLVWLLSDVLLRGPSLRPAPTAEALAAELTERLGVPVSVRRSTGGQLDEVVRVRRLDTWHVGWGLPRPSLIALQAGSCVALTVAGPIDPARLRDVEAGGLGERTAEGYGHVCFDAPLLRATPACWPGVEADTPPEMALEPLAAAHLDFARLIESEVWKQELRRAALGIAADAARRWNALRWDATGNKPPMSQLGGLRGQVAQLRTAADGTAAGAATVLAWLKHLGDNTRRAIKWPGDALERLRGLLQDVEAVWTLLDCTNWPTLRGDPAALRRDLWPLAVRTLLDACIRAHKRELESPHGA